MRNHSYLIGIVFLAGCSKPPESVYVDLNLVPVPTGRATTPTQATVGQQPSQLSLGSQTVAGSKELNVENLRAEEKEAIRKQVQEEASSAIATITERLQDYYSREIDELYKKEFAKLVPMKAYLTQGYLAERRTIFEKSAKARAPLLTRLSFLTNFPPIEKPIPIDATILTESEKKKRAEINQLVEGILAIDQAYEADLDNLELKYTGSLEKETENIQARLAEKQNEIDNRANEEATKLVRRFSSGLAQRIFSRYTFQLKEIPTKTVNFPKNPALPGVPKVTFDRGQLNKVDRQELNKELDTFLSLHRYVRSGGKLGARDVTQEFIEWRMNLKSGHWESWQESSKRN